MYFNNNYLMTSDSSNRDFCIQQAIKNSMNIALLFSCKRKK